MIFPHSSGIINLMRNQLVYDLGVLAIEAIEMLLLTGYYNRLKKIAEESFGS